MAQGEGFKHITVTAPEEDDVVIVAGAVEETAAHEAPPEPSAEEEAAEPEAAAPEAAAPEAAKPEAAAPQPEKKAQPPKPARKDDYRETTLDDLTSTPMPLAQRIVIAAAIICIIGAIIYCVAFMG